MSKIKKKNKIWHFDEYFKYLESNSESIPAKIKDFVLNPNKYLLKGQETLYDSFLKKMNYNVSLAKKTDTLNIVFVNSLRTKKTHFKFNNIVELKCDYDIKYLKENNLLFHEFSIDKEGIYKYEFVFVDMNKIKVKFKYISIEEKKIE